jgi:acetyl-CoA carboxylase carboxyl transferase subunit beta
MDAVRSSTGRSSPEPSRLPRVRAPLPGRADIYRRILTDEGSFEETEAGLGSADPLEFEDLKPYKDRLEAAEKKTGRKDAVITGPGTLDGLPIALGRHGFRLHRGIDGVGGG